MPCGGKECTRRRVIILFAIVSLETHDWNLKLRAHKSMKGDQSRKNIRFVTQQECPGIVRIIIQNDKIILKTRIAQ